MADDGKRPRSGWRTAGIVLAVVVGVAGLVALGLFIAFMVMLNNYGENK